MTWNVVFDFGAVLFTWQPHRILQQHLPVHADSEARARQLAADIFTHEDWQSFDRGTLHQDEVVARTARRLGLPQADLGRMVRSIPEHLTPIPETVALLSSLAERRRDKADVQLYFLSNMPEPYARVLQQRHDFLSHFAGGVFSGDVKLIKPEPEIFGLLNDRHGLDPARTVFIDDHPANVRAARDYGWHAVHCEDTGLVAPALAAHLG